MSQAKKKYFIADAYTDKGTFKNCVYMTEGYGFKYVYPSGSSKKIKIMIESCCFIIREISEEESLKYIRPNSAESLIRLVNNGYSLEKMLKILKHTKTIKMNYGLEHELITFDDESSVYIYSGKILRG